MTQWKGDEQMSDVKQYKCPACGGAMEFDSKSQKMKCPYCDTEMELDKFEELQKETAKEEKKEQGKDSASWEASGNAQWQEGETDGMRIYVCESCGGEVIADESTGATECPFCGNRIVMKGQFKGDLKPDYIIPFKLDKKDAKEAYHKHLTGKPFLPRIFKAENHIDEIKGVYVPFWLFDIDADADIDYNAERSRSWRSGDTEYTEHSYYEASRSGNISFDHIPEDGSKKMDDTLMESVEPYNFKDAVPFKAAYLAGYMADRYDVEMEERIGRAKERVKQSVEDDFKKTVTGYDIVTPKRSNINYTNAKYWYALYPVWILNTTWHNKKFVFAMNGQTGKIVGDLPVDNGLFWKFVTTRGAIFAAVIYAIRLIWSLI